MEVMVQHSTAISLTELHRAVSLPKSSTLILLQTPEQRGYATRNPAGAALCIAAPWLTEVVGTAHE
jgi:DNA-binding IclR family transcriptional regulator